MAKSKKNIYALGGEVKVFSTALITLVALTTTYAYANIDRRARPPEPREVVKTSGAHAARVTFYDPDIRNKMEGGGRNCYGERINSIEDAIHNGRPVSVAADIYGSFGRRCNRRNHRCTILIHAKGFDRLFPQYRKRFPHLPHDCFIGIVEDTGGAFFGTNGRRLDIAVRNRGLSKAAPAFFHTAVRWTKLEDRCGDGAASRQCDLTLASVDKIVTATLNVESVE